MHFGFVHVRFMDLVGKIPAPLHVPGRRALTRV